MKKAILSLSIVCISCFGFSQSEPFPNGGFEEWLGSGNTLRPLRFHTNKDGNSTAQLGPVTATKDTDNPHSGTACVRVESKSYMLGQVIVNGNLTTGFVNAPSTVKAYGYIGTQNHDDLTESRKLAFHSRPDSLVGYFKYSPANDVEEKGKINVVLHVGEFNDPETPVMVMDGDVEKGYNHADLSANKIGSALFVTENQKYSEWTRFSVPFTYVSEAAPEGILVNITSSNNQTTSKAGSVFWLDDLELIYKEAGVNQIQNQPIQVYRQEQSLVVDLSELAIDGAQLLTYDVSGKEIINAPLKSNQLNKIEIPTQYQHGIYFYKIVGTNFVNNGKIKL